MYPSIVEYRPPRIAQLLLLAAVLLNWLTPMHEWLLWQNSWAGIALFVAGFAVMIIAWYQFRRADVAICPTAPTARLITDGIYRLSRNPMYLGMTSMLLGLAVIVGTLPFYLSSIAFFAVMNWRFCPFEEAKLLQDFGLGFREYSRGVRRWL